MSLFFAERRPGELGLAVFLNAGDPPFDVLKHLVLMLDAHRVDCLELAVPFPNSATDGPVIRRSARRALDRGVDLNAALDFVEALRPQLSHLKIALLADWSHTVKGWPLRAFLREVQSAGVDGLLLHGLPPRARAAYYETARLVGVPVVTTCYATSGSEVLDEAAGHGSAYLYLIARYGRSGTSPPSDYRTLAPVIQGLRKITDVPIAVGFGIRARAHLEGVREAGADAAILGSAAVSCVEQAQEARRDVVEDLRTLLLDLGAIP